MGGNVTVLNKHNEPIEAQKVDLKAIGRSEFVTTSKKLFKYLNTIHQSMHGAPLWPKESHIDDAMVFNGSTSFVMSDDFKDEDILSVKPSVGDIDIAIPAENSVTLFKMLKGLQGRKILKNVEYVGMNREDENKLGTQINSIFLFTANNMDFLVQVDFEFLPFETGSPTEWARFSHSSNFEDTAIGIKALHHKYLIRAMIGALSLREDIIVVTPKSTPAKLTPSKKDSVVRMLKFSVDHGVRIAYREFLDDSGNPLYLDGKRVFKEIPTKDSDYKKTVREIFNLAFGDPDDNDDFKKMWSFIGVLQLAKKYLNQKQIADTAERYYEMMWGRGGQKLERDDPEEDARIKAAGWNKFKEILKVSDPKDHANNLTAYYSEY